MDIFFSIRRPGKTLPIFLFAIMSMLITDCRSTTSSKPSVQITQIPPADPGGPVQMGFIEGRATGVAPGEQIVLYVHSGIWWIQPFASEPFTNLQPDSSWRNSTHLGTEYAALLVVSGYRPPSKLTTLPPVGNGVVAVATTAGQANKPIVSKVVHFSGYDWNVRTAASDRGGQANLYDPANVWTDDQGLLHLRIQQHDGVWSSAEVSLARSLGYGTYTFVVRDTSHLGPSAALGLYTADDFRTNDIPNELAIELSRWGIADSQNAQYVVQPFYVSENVSRFTAPPGVLTNSFHWEPGRASFRTVRGSIPDSHAGKVSEHAFTSGIPTPANERAHISLYEYRRSKSEPRQPEEIVIERFEYLP